MPTTQEPPTTSPIGRSTPRVDGPWKVTGTAQYTSDFHFPGMLVGVPVEATINIGKIFRSVLEVGFGGICEERRPPFEDDVVRYYGQYVALAVADTFESAKAAADAVHVTYSKEKPNVESDLQAENDPETVSTSYGPEKRLQSERGDPEAAFANAPVKLDQTYVTPAETHNPIELQGTTAIWDGQMLT